MKRVFVILALSLSSACTARSTQSAANVQERALTELLPPSRLSYDFMWRQRVTAEWPSGKDSFEAVLQKRGGELLMVGLSPMGLPGFTLTLQGDGAIRVENRMGRDLPFEPAYVLADVERVFFPWFEAAPTGDGERSADVAGQHVIERTANGALTTRSFTRTDAPDAGSVQIVYSAPQAGEDAPRKVTLDNAWYRYRLTIETFEQSRL